MIKTWILVTLLITVFGSAEQKAAKRGKHLFILSGQSNMAELDPRESFLPMVEKAFGKKRVIVVKDAMGSQPIRRWYRAWKPLKGDVPKADPALYDSLIRKVNLAIHDERIATITFIWMQGERDARERLGDVYERSLHGLYQQLCDDLRRKDVNFIIGRLSDFGLENANYPDWNMIRSIQVKAGESNPRFAWVNTDDLNDGADRTGKVVSNDLHMSAEGYVLLGKRFAQTAIGLIKAKSK